MKNHPTEFAEIEETEIAFDDVLDSQNRSKSTKSVNNPDGKWKRIMAIEDYDGKDHSELTFDAGEIILLLEGPDEDGICFGKHVAFGLEG